MRQVLRYYSFDVQARPYTRNLISAVLCVSIRSNQVVASGPGGFMSTVENILAEMGVPLSAIVLLD